MIRVAFKTVGCRLNQAETARITGQFTQAGYVVVQDLNADILVINSCTITDNARKTSARFSRTAKSHNPRCIVVITGCAAQIHGKDLMRESGADIVAGQEDKFRILQLLSAHGIHTPSAATCKTQTPDRPLFSTTRANIKVQDGCNFRCAYCIVPDARGNPVSRPQAEIVDEINRVAQDGFKEIILTGANLACYGKNTSNTLIQLLQEVEDIDGIKRVRLSSIEISTTERQLIDYMATSKKLCRYLHFPLQSGDDRILAAMGRRYTCNQYRSTVEYALEHIPHLGLGTDLLTGLPGEDDKAFHNTCDLIDSLPFHNLHVFSYSKRPNTPAATMPNQVPDAVKKQRNRTLTEIGRRKMQPAAESYVGQHVSVLIEKSDGKTSTGWTSQYMPIRIMRSLEINTIHRVTVSSFNQDKRELHAK